MRLKYAGTARDGNGRIIDSATVAVFLTGTSTVASVYTTLTGAVAVNSVTSDSAGIFSFYHDAFDYDFDQRFDITISKTGFTSKTYPYVIGDVVTGNYTISTAKTTTSYFKIPEGVVFVHAAGGSIVFNGGFEAGLYQVFSGFDSGDITFGASAINTVYPEWWGSTGINSAVDSFGATNGIVLVGDSQTLSANLTVPSNVTLKITLGGMITKASTYTLTINGPIDAGVYKIFSGFADGNISITAQPFAYPEWTGCLGDDATNDTTALQIIVSAIEGYSKLLVPQKTYRFTGTITVSGSLEVEGLGPNSKFNHYAATGDGFSVATLAKVIFRNLNLINTNDTKTSGAAIRFVGVGVDQVVAPVVSHCTFGDRTGNGNHTDIWVESAGAFNIHHCEMLNSAGYGILLNDDLSSDSTIEACFLNTGIAGASAGIHLNGSPGLKIFGCKILGYTYGIVLNPSYGSSHGPLIVSLNSIENQATAGVLITDGGDASSAGGLAFTGNEIGQAPVAISISTSGTGYFEHSNFSGNTIASTTGHCVYINGGNHITFKNNTIYGGLTGFYVDAGTMADIKITNNSIKGVTTRYDGDFADVVVVDFENAVPFAILTAMAAANGSMIYCSDGTIAATVNSGGTGCLAKRLVGAWVGN
jgi:predicted enzyme related to lactoylglutathione lyase